MEWSANGGRQIIGQDRRRRIHMNTFFLRVVIAAAFACPPLAAYAQAAEKLPSPDKLPPPATTVYRQVLPDGRVIYSDEPVKGSKIDQTIKVDPPIKGNTWAAESGAKPVARPKEESTPVRKVATPPSQRKSLEQAGADVVRAEMLLEDAKKRQQAGVEPVEGERTGNAGGGSRLNETYEVRQKWLAREVEQAEVKLKNAIKERDNATSVR
jgi:hypothetical protein